MGSASMSARRPIMLPLPRLAADHADHARAAYALVHLVPHRRRAQRRTQALV